MNGKMLNALLEELKSHICMKVDESLDLNGYQETLNLALKNEQGIIADEVLCLLPYLETKRTFIKGLPYILEVNPDTGKGHLRKRIEIFKD